jgi:hypothetical protein
MKQTSDGKEVPSDVYYYLLSFNDRDEKKILNETFGVGSLKDLDFDNFWKLFKIATETDLSTYKPKNNFIGFNLSDEEMEEWGVRMEKQNLILENQIKRFYNKYENVFPEFVDKTIEKYNSKKYRDYWYDVKHQEPPEDLYWFLYDYVKVYGCRCTESEWEKYGNMFTMDLVYKDGYYFNQMNGQGSCVIIIKQGEE